MWFGFMAYQPMPNPFYRYILNIGFVNKYFVDNIFKWAKDHFVCTQLNGFKYCYVTLTIKFNISYLFAHI